jgi:hypothetical protein
MILADSHILPARCLRYIFTLGVLLFVYLGVSFASEPLQIESILASPRSYAQHDGILQGRAMQIRKTEPYSCSKTVCGPATVAYSFILQDDTATIDVIVPCSCFGQMFIVDGERVTVTVSIRIIEKDGLQPPAVVGVAHDIRASTP